MAAAAIQKYRLRLPSQAKSAAVQRSVDTPRATPKMIIVCAHSAVAPIAAMQKRHGTRIRMTATSHRWTGKLRTKAKVLSAFSPATAPTAKKAVPAIPRSVAPSEKSAARSLIPAPVNTSVIAAKQAAFGACSRNSFQASVSQTFVISYTLMRCSAMVAGLHTSRRFRRSYGNGFPAARLPVALRTPDHECLKDFVEVQIDDARHDS
jgi:hypothetical protein